ncbi:hypothetical protein [Chryseobacterium sp. 2987]|uniref:hypothetical protein n=1 Tax=Chryseobacterium sp. 2987 TaxID=2817767 RepID=UPI002867153F|nr:hypothetical protein [Chryseobacterium sp. 2987]MDR6920880.1 hypothetical protein [Chryseobacterium sp. 2987]
MGKESYIGGDYIETTGGDAKTFAGKSIVNSSVQQFAQTGETAGVSYKANAAPPSLGSLDLIKIKINTTFDVCHDEVSSFSEFKNFWILEDKGKYYHWLSLRGNSDDKNKPDPLPITLASTDNFVFTATFKTKGPITCKIRVQDSNKKYVFKEQQHPKKNKDEEHELTFTCDTKPYKDTVQYLENFTLHFEYSEDGTNWVPMKSVKFCLYLTWKTPLYNNFENLPSVSDTMQIKCQPNKNQKNIFETLLWLGCKGGSGKGNTGKTKEENEEIVLDSIFKQFETLKIIRRREGQNRPDGTSYLTKNWSAEGLGYWRGISAVDANPLTDARDPRAYMFYDAATGAYIERTSRVILKYGEFRCGEWTAFLLYIGFAQGIALDQFAIFSGRGHNDSFMAQITTHFVNLMFLVKGWNIKDPLAPELPPSTAYRAQGNANPLHYFSDHVFTLFERNGVKKYYDASYGLRFKSGQKTDKKLLAEYSTSALTGVLYMREKTPGKSEYKTITTNMEQHLVISLYKGLGGGPYLTDDKITYTL